VLGLRCRVGGAGGLLCEVPGRSLGRLGLALPRRRGGRGFAAVLYGRESIFSQTHQKRGPPGRTLAHLPALACQPPHVGRWVGEGGEDPEGRTEARGAGGGCPRGVRVAAQAGAPGAASPPPAARGPPKVVFRAPGPPAHPPVQRTKTLTEVDLGGGAVSRPFCMAVSRFLAKRTKIGVRQAGLWLICPPRRASPRTSVGGYMKERK
jgi:hypothetical protein